MNPNLKTAFKTQNKEEMPLEICSLKKWKKTILKGSFKVAHSLQILKSFDLWVTSFFNDKDWWFDHVKIKKIKEARYNLYSQRKSSQTLNDILIMAK